MLQIADTLSSTSLLTSNALDHCQRARLIRSTRKLEAILGTTPHLTDVKPIHVTLPQARPPTSSATKASRRHASIFTIFPNTAPSGASLSDASIYSSTSTNSSVSSFSLPEQRRSVEALPIPKALSSRPRRAVGAPEPLVLRVNTVPVSPSDHRIPLSPLPAAAKQPDSPTVTEFPQAPPAAELRRKRMAKLARTFGESVPVEYVFPSASPRSGQRQPHPFHDWDLPPPTKRSSQIWMTGSSAGTWVGEWNRKDIKEIQHKLRALKAK